MNQTNKNHDETLTIHQTSKHFYDDEFHSVEHEKEMQEKQSEFISVTNFFCF